MSKKEILAAGGQAVIEGVLMRTKNKYAIAVRLPNNKIKVLVKKIKERKFSAKIPIWRGLVMLVDTIVLGSKALTWSSNQQIEEEKKKHRKREKNKGINTIVIIFTFILAIGLALLLFKFLPLWFAVLFDRFVTRVGNVTFNLIEGFVKIAIFILYLFFISLMKDVQQLFRYHGAEHKTVHCYQDGKNLTVKNVKKYSTKHPMCGSSFWLVVIFVSILLYILIPKDWNFWLKLGSRVALLPLIAGFSYEFLRLSGKYRKNWFFRALAWPGKLVQYITTKEPTSKQIEVAIRSLKAVIK
ncbi:DUF1385 domain-containing protein [Candidatus Woesearchaeota archaeon]|nr:MAG: DUF1385 domain-containing protein [Candidatus Woesearchaeota archaeon]